MSEEIIVQQNGDYKTRIRREDAEKFKKACLDEKKAEKMIRQHNGLLSRLLIGKTFDELIEELKQPDLKSLRKARIVLAANRRIKKYKKVAEKRLIKIPEKDKEKFKEVVEKKVKEMEETLKKAKNIDKVKELPKIEEKPKVEEKKTEKKPMDAIAFSEVIEKLNPGISYLVNVEGPKPVITFDRPLKEIILPAGFEYDGKDEISNKKSADKDSIFSVKARYKGDNKIVRPKKEEKVSEPIVEKQEEKKEAPETKKPEEKKDLNDLTQFTSYDEYLTEYLKQNVSPDEYEKFFVDFIHKKTPANMLSIEEFADKKRRQTEDIKYRKLEEKLHESEKKVIETINRLKAAQEYIDNLERKVVDDKQKMEAIRAHSTELEKSLADERTKYEKLVEEISQLSKQIKDRDASIKDQQKEIFSLGKKCDKAETELKKKDEKIEKMVAKAVDYENEIHSLKSENKDLSERNNKLETNIRTTIEKINSSKEEIEKIKKSDSTKIDEELQASKEKYKKQESGKAEPQHMREKAEPRHLREKAAPQHMREEKPVETEEPKVGKDDNLQAQLAELNNRKSLLEELLKAEAAEQKIEGKTR